MATDYEVLIGTFEEINELVVVCMEQGWPGICVGNHLTWSFKTFKMWFFLSGRISLFKIKHLNLYLVT